MRNNGTTSAEALAAEHEQEALPRQAPVPVAGGPVCCIIPAYDEAGRVGRVVALAVRSGFFSEVLVVDDASHDRTAREAEMAGARVLRHGKNEGKASAMRTGLFATRAPVVCFLDGDLVDVTLEHLKALIDPVLAGESLATVALFKGGRAPTTLAQQIAPFISGQRCLRRTLLTDFDDWDSGYGIETALHSHLKQLGVEQHKVEWHGASHIMKEEKHGLLLGAAMRAKMFAEIAATWFKSKFTRRSSL